MIGKHRTFRLLMAVYMALMIPLCCCFSSAWADGCCTPEQAELQTSVEQPHDHDHGHHDHDDQQPDGDQDNDDQVPSHDQDGSCDCGCDSSMDRPIPTKATENLNWSFVVVQYLPFEILQPSHRFQASYFRKQAYPPTCNSLLRLHCALIV